MLILSEADVASALSPSIALSACRQAFRALVDGSSSIPERTVLDIPPDEDEAGVERKKNEENDASGGRGGGATLFKPGLAGSALGLKVVSVRPDNAAKGLPTVPATMVMFHRNTGLPAAIMGGTNLTALRTAAGSALATELFARKDTNKMVVFGAGLQAKAHIVAICAVRPSISRVTLVNRTADRASALAATLVAERDGLFTNVPEFDIAQTPESVEAAVRNADIICTTTNSSTPLFNGAWLKPGVHLNCIGSYTPTMQEVDETTIERCTSIVLDSDHALVAGDLQIPAAAQCVDRLSNIVGSIGEYLLEPTHNLAKSTNLVRTSEAAITLFKSVGTAVQDLVTAQVALENAKKMNLGSTIEF